MDVPRVRLGELLVRAGLVTAEQLDEALVEQRRVGKRLGSLLVETGLVSETQVTQILSQQLSVPWVSLHHIDFSRQLLDLVPLEVVEQYCLIPIYVRRVRGLGDALYVAMDDPTNAHALQQVAERSGMHVRAMIAPPSDIRSAIHAYYGVGAPPPSAEPPIPVSRPEPQARDDEEEDVPTGIHPRVVLPARPEAAAVQAPSQPEIDRAVDELVGGPPAGPESGVRVDPGRASATPPAREPSPSSPDGDRKSSPGGDRKSSPDAARRSKPDLARILTAPLEEAPTTSRSGDSERARLAPGKSRKMVALTLLDGTTIHLPAKGAPSAEEGRPAEGGEHLTARDLIAALRATSHGADASDILGEGVSWEAMFAALLSLLLKKHLIADWEFVQEYKKT